MLGFYWMSVHNSVLAFLTMIVKCYETMADCQTLSTRSKVDTATSKHHVFPCTYVFPCILGLTHYTLATMFVSRTLSKQCGITWDCYSYQGFITNGELCVCVWGGGGGGH